jgi:hypothetical protein
MAVMQGTVQGQGAFPVQGVTNKIQGPGVSGGSSPGVFDPNFANVTALLHFDGANGSTVFTDQLGHTFARSGGGVQVLSTASPKFGSAAGQTTVQNDTGNIAGPNSSDFASNGAFTYEGWAQNLSLINNGVIFSMAGTVSYGFFHVFTTGAVSFYDGTSHPTGVNLTVDGKYHHFAISSAGPGLTIMAFIDGVQVYSGVAVAGGATNNLVPIGGNSILGIGGMFGYVDEVRFTKGVNRYTGPFAPPTAPFPNS